MKPDTKAIWTAILKHESSSTTWKDLVIGVGAAFDPLPAPTSSTFETNDSIAFAVDFAQLVSDRNAVLRFLQSKNEFEAHRAVAGRDWEKHIHGQGPHKLAKIG